MDHCRSCSERGADQCVALWNFESHVIAYLRGSANIAQRAGAAHITIAHFLCALCHDETAADTLRRIGADPRVLESALEDSVSSVRQRSAQSRIVLSQSLNALLVAAEHTALHAGQRVVTLDMVMATLLQNAAQDVAAGVLHRLVTGAQGHAPGTARVGAYGARSQRHSGHHTSHSTVANQAISMQSYRTERGYQSAPVNAHPTAAGQGQPPRGYELSTPALTRQMTPQSAFQASRADRPQHSAPPNTTRARSGPPTPAAATLRTAQGPGRQGGTAQRAVTETASEYEHFETILRMLRVQEARLERLETETKNTSGRSSSRSSGTSHSLHTSGKSGRLKIRKLSLGAVSARSGTSSKAQSKESRGSSRSDHTRAHEDTQRASHEARSRSSSGSAGWSERGTRSQSSGAGAGRSNNKGSSGASYAQRDGGHKPSSHGIANPSSNQPPVSDGANRERGRTKNRDYDRDRRDARGVDQDRDARRSWPDQDRDRASDADSRDPRNRDSRNRDPRDWDHGDTNARDRTRSESRSERSDYGAARHSRADSSKDKRTDRRSGGRSDETSETANGKKEKRFYLSLDDDLVDAPSIGPKTAARFTPLGIHTVRDLLALDSETVAAQLKVRHISADVLRDWQDQARLVCTVPWLRGTHAQLLVGADFRSAGELAKADLGEVLASILRFAATNQGERILRTNPPPEREKVATWLGFAQQADVSRVA